MTPLHGLRRVEGGRPPTPWQRRERWLRGQRAELPRRSTTALALLFLVGAGAAFAADSTDLMGDEKVDRAGLAILKAQRESPGIVPQQTIARWSVFELPLTSAQTYANPYTDATVTATFTGPGNITKTVRGFWNGGRSFKIRFAPTAEGMWTYTTLSTPADTGLATSGSITVTAPVAGNHGFVRRSPSYPYHFLWDDGRRYFMSGNTYYSMVLTALAGDTWKAAIDGSKSYGMTKIRLLIYPWGATKFPDSQPFTDSGHGQPNLAHWGALDRVVRYIGSQDMVADLIIFADNARQFTGNRTVEQRYVRYALSRYAAYHNVIWNLCNEWEFARDATRGYANKTFWSEIGRLVRDEDPWMAESGSFRLLSIHNKNQDTVSFQFFDASWPVHVSLQHSFNSVYPEGDRAGHFAIANNWGRNMSVVNDEYAYITIPWGTDRTDMRQGIWASSLAGGYTTTGDSHDMNGKPRATSKTAVWNTGEWYDAAPEYGDIQRLINFWTTRGIEYWKMKRETSIITAGSRVYLTGIGGQAYVAYAAVGGTFNLNLPNGTYQVQWYGPTSGRTTSAGTVSGGNRSFVPPFGGDAVLYLKRQ